MKTQLLRVFTQIVSSIKDSPALISESNLNLAYKKSYNLTRLAILLPIILSAFTHLWNPAGFPDTFYDEGVYMRRAMHVLSGAGPQEGFFYDHPYFGQLFLAGVLKAIGYPDLLHPSPTAQSIETLYTAPRILMGILAVFDTVIIYKISERRYSKKVALISSILFAVMPITWLTRRILLDSILLPFFLASILFAIYTPNTEGRKKVTYVSLSGIFLGLAIFTKIPIFTMIPLVGYLVYSTKACSNRHKTKSKLKTLGLWIIPVIMIPTIWPAYSAYLGQFDLWIKDMIWQTQRQSQGLGSIAIQFFLFDPILMLIGTAGIIYSVVRKDEFVLLWTIPFVIFLSLIGYLQYFYWIPLLPIFCIAGARLIELTTFVKSTMPYLIISGVAIFGLISTALLISSNVTSAQYNAAAFLANKNTNETTIAANSIYSWLLIYVFHKENILQDYRDLLFLPIETKNLLLVADKDFHYNINAGKQLVDAYNSSKPIAVFRQNSYNYDTGSYPYTSMNVNYGGLNIEIRERDK
jgi:dolichyl-phosphate-mannose-protein mannosyltransferase